MFDRIDEQELVRQEVGLPPLGLTGDSTVPVYTYRAHWLALNALWNITCLEEDALELAEQLEHSQNMLHASEQSDNDLEHWQTEHENIQEEIHDTWAEWSLALLELVFLYRLHCDVVNPNRLQHAPHHIRTDDHHAAANLSGVARAALVCGYGMFDKTKNCLEKHHRHHTGAAMPYAGTDVPGSPLECADALRGFMGAACKVEHSDGLPTWVHEEAQQVLIFFAAQVCHEHFALALVCALTVLIKSFTGQFLDSRLERQRTRAQRQHVFIPQNRRRHQSQHARAPFHPWHISRTEDSPGSDDSDHV